MAASITGVADPCPRCAVPQTTARGAAPWCPACEWDLDRFEPDRARAEFGRGWLDRRLHRVAYRLTAGQFAALRRAPLTGPSVTVARVVTLTAAVLLILGVFAVAAAGGWLIADDLNGVTTLFGVVLLGLAYALRPRLSRLRDLPDDIEWLDPASVPALFGLVERVATEVGAPMVHRVGLSPGFNAFTVTVGLRRRRVLCVGAALWATLGPAERVALVGHELGHFVNGDLRRGPLNQAAETTLGKLAYLLSPSEDGRSAGFLTMVAALLVGAVMGLLSGLIFGAHLLLVWVSQRDSQRAEYLADELAARVAGTTAAVRLFDQMLISTSIDTVVRREARAGRCAEAWYAAAEQARGNLAPALPGLRQLSRRDEVSLFASHPPTGLRATMLEQRPARPAAITLTPGESGRIDAELAGHYERVRRELAC